MKYILAILAVLSAGVDSFAQYISSVNYPDTMVEVLSEADHASVKYAKSITPQDLEKHLSVLASDSFQGREAGSQGIEKASQYISNYFESIDLKKIGDDNSFEQKVAFTWSSWARENMDLTINGVLFKHLKDYLAFPEKNNSDELQAEEVVFLGFGIDDPNYSDYKNNNVNGKVIVVYDGEPVNKKGISQVSKSEELSGWSTNSEKKLLAAKEHGVRHMIIISKDFKGFLAENRRKAFYYVTELGIKPDESPYCNTTYVSSNIARELFGDKLKKVIRSRDRSKKRGKARDIKLNVDLKLTQKSKRKVLEGKNMLGYIEGSDKKDELIVISAHYDHIGMRGNDIYNGANDNGSGTSTVLEIAEAFKLAKNEGPGPRRSILCLLVTAEEKGLLGSQYYSEKPVFSLENTVCNINIDMVGRSDKKYKNEEDYIYVIGSDRLSTDLHKINEKANHQFVKFILDYTYNDEKDKNRFYYRSDHYNFAKNGIPAIFYFNGVHKDYHRTSDTIEKMNFNQMAKTGRLIFHTAWELANREDRIVVDGEVK